MSGITGLKSLLLWQEQEVLQGLMARARGFAGILLGTEQAPNADEEIDRKKTDGSYELTDAERKEKKRLRQANGNAYQLAVVM